MQCEAYWKTLKLSNILDFQIHAVRSLLEEPNLKEDC
jgi:hypothetical protein